MSGENRTQKQDVHVINQAAVKGGLTGLTLSTAFVLLFHRFHPEFRGVDRRFKMGVVSICTAAGAIMAADDASRRPLLGEEYGSITTTVYPVPLNTTMDTTEQENPALYHQREVVRENWDRQFRMAKMEHESMRDYVWRQRFRILGVSYAAGLAGFVGWATKKFPNEPLHLRLLQGRLVAQGLTVTAMMALLAFSRENQYQMTAHDH